MFVAGCAPIVNIPPQKSDVATHDPNNIAVKQIMLRSLQSVLADQPIREPFQVVLPHGTLAESYAAMLPRLSTDARWAGDRGAVYLPMLAITQLRIRGLDAEVDMVRPQNLTEKTQRAQLVTASLKFEPIGGWYVTRLRLWDVRREPDAHRLSGSIRLRTRR